MNNKHSFYSGSPERIFSRENKKKAERVADKVAQLIRSLFISIKKLAHVKASHPVSYENGEKGNGMTKVLAIRRLECRNQNRRSAYGFQVRKVSFQKTRQQQPEMRNAEAQISKAKRSGQFYEGTEQRLSPDCEIEYCASRAVSSRYNESFHTSSRYSC